MILHLLVNGHHYSVSMFVPDKQEKNNDYLHSGNNPVNSINLFYIKINFISI